MGVQHFQVLARIIELGIGSYSKSRTLMPAAQRLSIRSSGNCSMWLMSYAMFIAAGEAGLKRWEEEDNGSDMVMSIGLGVKPCRFDEKVSGVGVSGLAS